MSEPEKRGSALPWILVPIATVTLFFVLRECRQALPAAEHATSDVPAPAAPADNSAATQAPTPAPQ
jgi:hypothetical protein